MRGCDAAALQLCFGTSTCRRATPAWTGASYRPSAATAAAAPASPERARQSIPHSKAAAAAPITATAPSRAGGPAGVAAAPAAAGRVQQRRLQARCMASSAIAPAAAAEAKPLPLVLVVAVALLDGEGRVLLAQRPPGKKLAGLWEFPGGKVDPGEGPETALVRELQEELGITVAPAALRPLTFASHAYDSFHLLMPTYECRQWEGEPSGEEGQALAWVTADELEGGTFDMPPADLPMLPPVLAAMQAQRAAAAAAAGPP